MRGIVWRSDNLATWCRIDDVEIGPLPNLELNLKMSWTPNVKHYSNSKKIVNSYELMAQITLIEKAFPVELFILWYSYISLENQIFCWF